MAAEDLMKDNSFWLNRSQVEEAEYKYQVALSVKQFGDVACPQGSLASEIAKARNQIKQSLNLDTGVQLDSNVINRIVELERENKELRQVTSDLQAAVKKLEARINSIEGGKPAEKPAAKKEQKKSSSSSSSSDSDDDFELFGSDDESEEDEEAIKERKERLAKYAEKKGKKPALIAKSNIILDVKPWDDETDMKELEQAVRSIEMDGLLWGTSKLVPVGYGIKKLQISCVVEDDKVSTDDLEEKITAFEDYVQSMDIAAFNKV